MKTTWILAAALLVSTVAMTQGQGPRGQMGANKQANCPNRAHLGLASVAALNLSDEQKTQMQSLHQAHMKKVEGLTLDMEEKRIELKRLTLSDAVDQKAIDKTIDEIFALKASIAKERVNKQNLVRNLLSDEQKGIYDTRKASFKGGAKGQMHAHRTGQRRGNGAAQGPVGRGQNCPWVQ